MGILNSINTESSVVGKSKNVQWIALNDMAQLDEIINDSNNKSIIVKHSTRCGISTMVLGKFEQQYDIPRDRVKPYFLDLLNHRDISNVIADRFHVKHESPQILLIDHGQCTYNSSHDRIQVKTLKDKLDMK